MIRNTDQLDPFEASKVLGVSPRSLAEMRRRRQGPKYYKLTGKIIRYTRGDLLRWLEEQIIEPRP